MRYRGFATRDYLILENIPLRKNLYVLEIGVGTGSTVELFKGRVKEYCGVDISSQIIDYLSQIYKDDSSVKFYCMDVCKEASFLNKKFDVIFSADTFEHIKAPRSFFIFINRHLSPTGIALVTYPNESEEEHHGITWFDSQTEILELINSSGLRMINFYQVKATGYHQLIKNFLWKLPKSIIKRGCNSSPQTFEQTDAFRIIQDGGIKAKLFEYYATTLTKMATLFPLYNYFKVTENNINNKVLLMLIKHK